MAITKTTSITHISVTFEQDPPIIMIDEKTVWDDPEDDQLPIDQRNHRELRKNTLSISYNEETGDPIQTEELTDISGEDQLVQDIAAVVWA
jgi:hypothetical protein